MLPAKSYGLPLLHAAADNTNAVRLYEALGFEACGTTRFLGARVPAAEHRRCAPVGGRLE
jgi:hypothetical protein